MKLDIPKNIRISFKIFYITSFTYVFLNKFLFITKTSLKTSSIALTVSTFSFSFI